MRTLWLALIPVALLTGSISYGKEPQAEKAPTRVRGIASLFATSRTESPTVIEQTPQVAPVSQAAPPPGPVLAPAGPPPVVQLTNNRCQAAPACGKSHCKPCKLCDWFCYQRKQCGKGCGYYYSRPLYLYFLGQCHEGYCPQPQCTGPTCGKAGCWSKNFATGHSMFNMPTGHGVCGAH